MLSLENTHTIADLVRNACEDYDDRVFLRYERNDSIYDVTYRHLAGECRAFAAWAKDRKNELGHSLKAGLLGSASSHYIALMLGLMAGGAVAVPLDIQQMRHLHDFFDFRIAIPGSLAYRHRIKH